MTRNSAKHALDRDPVAADDPGHEGEGPRRQRQRGTFAEKYVGVGAADVSVMTKYLNGQFVVFTASGKPARPPNNSLRVAFKLAEDYTGPVRVPYEGGRVLHATDGAFTDTFANEDSVHIYGVGLYVKAFAGDAKRQTMVDTSMGGSQGGTEATHSDTVRAAE